MQLNQNIFRANDIRGIAYEDLTEEVVQSLGKALGSEAIDRNVQEFIVGRDARLSSPQIFDWLSSGIISTGCDVIDIGINNPVENYLDAIEEHKPDILGMSALLTTTMPYMKVVVDAMIEKGIRDDYIVLVGGAPLNEAFGESVGADAYCRDAAVAVETAKDLIAKKFAAQAAS